jgi:hypothetical protein
MELPSSAYLYTLALLAMTFVGFTAIVMILRQSLGGPLSRFDTLVARFFMAWGFLITYGAMLPPLLAAFELHHPLVWRASSTATGLMLLTLSFGYPMLRGQATGARAPTFVLVQSAIGAVIGVILLVNAAQPFPLLVASATYLAVLTFTLIQASVGFIVTINVMLTGVRPDEPATQA